MHRFASVEDNTSNDAKRGAYGCTQTHNRRLEQHEVFERFNFAYKYFEGGVGIAVSPLYVDAYCLNGLLHTTIKVFNPPCPLKT